MQKRLGLTGNVVPVSFAGQGSGLWLRWHGDATRPLFFNGGAKFTAYRGDFVNPWHEGAMTPLAGVVFPETPAGAGKDEFRKTGQRGDVILQQNCAVVAFGTYPLMQGKVGKVFQAGGGRRQSEGSIHHRSRTIISEPSDEDGNCLLADRLVVVPITFNLLAPVHAPLLPGDRKRFEQHF